LLTEQGKQLNNIRDIIAQKASAKAAKNGVRL